MDHIKSYFIPASSKLIEKKIEKETVCELIQELSGVVLEKNDITIKNNIIKLKIFGTKRAKVISLKNEIIDILKKKNNIIIVSLE